MDKIIAYNVLTGSEIVKLNDHFHVCNAISKDTTLKEVLSNIDSNISSHNKKISELNHFKKIVKNKGGIK